MRFLMMAVALAVALAAGGCVLVIGSDGNDMPAPERVEKKKKKEAPKDQVEESDQKQVDSIVQPDQE